MKFSTAYRHLSILENKRSFIYIMSAMGAIAAVALAGGADASDSAPPKGELALPIVAASAKLDGGANATLTGVVQSATPLEASSPTGGRVIKVLVNVGDRVQAGQPLAILDGRAATLRSQQAFAEVDRAQAIAGERAAAASRAQTMLSGGALSSAEAEALAAEAKAASAAVRAASAAARAAAHEAGQMVIRAPASGTVAERTIDPGAVAAPGQKLFSIESDGQRILFAALPQRLAATIRSGDAASYSTDGTSGTAVIVGVSPRVADGGVVPVRLLVTSGNPMPGSVARLALGLSDATPSVVRVPAGAIAIDQNGARYVYVVDKSGRARRTRVDVIGFSGGMARISGAVRPEQTVVAAGAAFVSPGQRVFIAQAGV